MDLIEIAAAFMLSLSFILFLWMLKGFLLRPASRGNGNQVAVVVRTDGEAKEIDRVLAGLCWLRDDGLLKADIIVVGEGMDAVTEASLDALMRREPAISVCRPEALADYILRSTADGTERKRYRDTGDGQVGPVSE
jgi:hypothetical protein